jgi:sugar lactone lactonase YvrE
MEKSLSKKRAVALALALGFAGCSANGTSALPGTSPGNAAARAPVPATVSAFVYVLNAGGSSSSSSSWNSSGSLSEYKTGRPHLLNQISDGIDTPRAMAFDNGGNVYVANAGGGSSSSSSSGEYGSVTVYVGHGSELLRSITRGINCPIGVAVDGNGTLYVANAGGSGSSSSSSSSAAGEITVYKHHRNRVSYIITAGVNGPRAVALDASGNLYVLNSGAASSSSAAGGSVSVYAPGHRAPKMVLNAGIGVPMAMAVDAAGDVAVANAAGSSSTSGGSVALFAAGSNTPTTISNGIDVPRALAFDAGGTLYVGNAAGGSSSSSSSATSGTVTVYPSGSTDPSMTITDGITTPDAIAVAAGGALYVANAPASSSSSSSSSANPGGDVQVYPAGHASPRWTITRAISDPIAVGIN